jgi:hypothetical protein
MNYSNYETWNRWQLLMKKPYQVENVKRGTAKPQVTVKPLSTHDWGPFGEYEYLGKGTPYQEKAARGIEARNRIDEIAAYHDRHYSDSAHYPAYRSGIRGLADFGAGSAMLNASLNPFNDLVFRDRGLGLLAGTGLIIQGVARIHPVTALGMAVVDWAAY